MDDRDRSGESMVRYVMEDAIGTDERIYDAIDA